MATNIIKIQDLLKTLQIKFAPKSDTELVIIFDTKNYRNKNGEKELFLVVKLDENGEYFKLFAPYSFIAAGPFQDSFLKALLMVQYKTKLIQFEYESEDDEVRSMIEFPLEDNLLTAKQLTRCIHGMVNLVDTYFPVLDKALTTGEIDFESKEVDDQSTVLGNMLRNFSPEVLAEALRKADRRN